MDLIGLGLQLNSKGIPDYYKGICYVLVWVYFQQVFAPVGLFYPLSQGTRLVYGFYILILSTGQCWFAFEYYDAACCHDLLRDETTPPYTSKWKRRFKNAGLMFYFFAMIGLLEVLLTGM